MNTKFVIHSYINEEVTQKNFRRLASEWEADDAFWTAESILASLKNPSTKLRFVAGEDNAWKGCYFIQICDDTIELLYIHSTEAMRGQGLGRILLEDLIQTAQAHPDVARIFLEVRPANIAALKLYENCGFVRSGVRKRYYKDGEDAFLYEHTISR